MEWTSFYPFIGQEWKHLELEGVIGLKFIANPLNYEGNEIHWIIEWVRGAEWGQTSRGIPGGGK